MNFNKLCRHHRQLKELIIRESPWESKEMVLAVSKRILERQKSSNDFHNNSWSITIILLVAQNFKIHVVKLRTYLKSRRYYTASEKFQLLYPYYTVSNGRIRITNLWNLALFTPLTLFFFYVYRIRTVFLIPVPDCELFHSHSKPTMYLSSMRDRLSLPFPGGCSFETSI